MKRVGGLRGRLRRSSLSLSSFKLEPPEMGETAHENHLEHGESKAEEIFLGHHGDSPSLHRSLFNEAIGLLLEKDVSFLRLQNPIHDLQ
jgi:hypothetical protein